MQLIEYLSIYAAEHEYGLRANTIAFHRAAIGSWSRFEQREVTTDDLTPATLNRFLDWTRLNRKPDTFRTVRGAILTIWRHAFDTGRASSPPIGLRKMRMRRTSPTAWTPVEVEALLATVNGPDHWFRERFDSGIRRGVWWDSLIRTAYDTGMRLGDLMEMSPAQLTIQGDIGIVRYVASKTGDEFFRIIRPRTLYAVKTSLAQNMRSPGLIWPLWASRDAFYRSFRSIVATAKIRTGTFRWIRRTAVTWADIQTPGLGQQLAGHKSERVTADSYRDVSQIGRSMPSPPDLATAVELHLAKH
jgi:integrase